MTWPFDVRASRGSTVPSDDVNVTTVPFCTGVPAASITTAVISVLPLVGSTLTLDTRRIVVLVGASSGTLSQPAASRAAARPIAWTTRRVDDMWRAANDNSCMKLGGQGGDRLRPARAGGYAMAALLVGMSIMAILMGAALPVWNKQAQREREEEYLFRAHEYARAVMKFRQRIANTNPPSVDVLVQQRFLRRKYRDPISGEDFQLVYQTAGAGIQPGGPGNSTPGGVVPPGGGSPAGGFGSLPGAGTSTSGAGGTPSAGTGAPVPGAGIIGVVSKSKATSIKIYNGRTRYDQWAVTYQDVKPGKGLPPDLLQALNATNAAAGAAGPGGQPFGGGAPQPGGANPFGGAGAANPFGGGGANPFGTGGAANPFGGGGFGQPMAPGGAPAAPPGGAVSPFRPAYPAPPGAAPGGGIFGTPPKKNN